MSFSLAVKRNILTFIARGTVAQSTEQILLLRFFSPEKKNNNNLEFLIYSSEVAGITKPSILQKILPRAH